MTTPSQKVASKENMTTLDKKTIQFLQGLRSTYLQRLDELSEHTKALSGVLSKKTIKKLEKAVEERRLSVDVFIKYFTNGV